MGTSTALLLLLLSFLASAQAFSPHHAPPSSRAATTTATAAATTARGVRRHRPSQPLLCAPPSPEEQQRQQTEDDDNKQKKTPKKPWDERLNELLDRPTIDVEAANTPGQPPWLTAFKELVSSDYGMAEALYAGTVFSVLIFFSQQGVRVYKHCYFMPDAACPWDASPSVDLFF